MNKKIQFSIMLILALLIAIAIYYFDAAPKSHEFHKQFYMKEYNGIVNDILIDKVNHHNKTIICIDINNVGKTFRVRTPDANKRLFEIVNFGDTLKKKANSNEIIIIGDKGNRSVIYDLKYPR